MKHRKIKIAFNWRMASVPFVVVTLLFCQRRRFARQTVGLSKCSKRPIGACSKATTVKQVRPVMCDRPFKLPTDRVTDRTTKLNKRALYDYRIHPVCPKEIFILKQLKTAPALNNLS
uniref:Zinc-binding alcohol dehydrogenase domain-containing protein 2 n=1 Tax=Zeugodacus cucurbitae TaxID=28588 RepID=A0A0A1WSN5_ZEUCU